jgi:8-oxo-dGTP pyrophosphatase MutT (NUDIX family)
MGRPHPTVDVPGHHPGLLSELLACAVDPEGHAAELARGIAGVAADVPAGHVCATAWILDPSGDHVLVVRHDALGWSSPGGHVMPGESTAEAARREVAEETGLTEPALTAVLTGPLTVHVTDGAEPGHRHWNVAYLFTASREATVVGEARRPVRWVPIAELAGLDRRPDDLVAMAPWAREVLLAT